MGPWAYWLSMKKCRFVRRVQDMFSGVRFSRHRRCEPLPVVVYAHKSLIRRTLGTVDQKLQENKDRLPKLLEKYEHFEETIAAM